MSRACNRLLAAACCAAALLAYGPAASGGGLVGWVEIEKAPLEKPRPFDLLGGRRDGARTLRDLVAVFDRAAGRADLAAVVVRLREPQLARSQVEELGGAIERVRKAGKKVHIFTEIYGPAELLLGSYADEVIVQTGGAVSLPGLYTEEMFLADALALIGVKADMVQVGDYKGAAEQLGNSAPSKAWDENINQLLDGLYAGIRARMKAGRGLSDEQLDKAMENAWLASPEEAVRLGIVDSVVDRLALEDHLKNSYGDFEYAADLDRADRAAGLDASNPFALLAQIMEPPKRTITRDSIAILHIDGSIADGESTEGGLLDGPSVGSLTIREALKQIEDEDRLKGLLVRINSPGGSAIASESIWIGLRRIAEKKPVWVSVGSMAASGGYYIAVAADRIYVNPSSIVGSIGVVGGKFVLGGLHQMLHVNVVPRSRGPKADLFNSTRAWSDAERSLIRARMTETYDQFVDRVTRGRKGIDISKTGEGRLFTGERAIELKMADAIGGQDEAISDLAAKLGLEEGKFDVVPYPAPKSLGEVIESMFERFVRAPVVGEDSEASPWAGSTAVAALRELIGPRAWPGVRDSLSAMSQMRKEPVLLVSPRIMIFR